MDEFIHLRHYIDGWPVCWLMSERGQFRGTYSEKQVTCPKCKKYLLEDPA